MSVLKSKYDAELCCEHEWRAQCSAQGVECETCDRCGAWCQRDQAGEIVRYAAHGVEREAAE